MSRSPASRLAGVRPFVPLLLIALLCVGAPGAAHAQSLSVRVWADRGEGSVYEPGDPIRIGARTNFDAYMLVYEIDAEGAVHLLFPNRGTPNDVAANTTLDLPEQDDEQLVIEGPVGEGYIVAIASTDPFQRLPWYLRPRDAQADELGYTDDDETDGVTRDGKIVGDPFVAMERIRREVLADPTDKRGFATAYTSYYVHHEVRYPRYLCNDCHRPGYYAWWDGFDPYYSTCSVFEFRVNSGWWWGPTYWTGFVPYYAYVYRDNCPPRYRPHGTRDGWFSSWDGWRRWGNLWGGPLRRYKTPPPPGYVGPGRFDWAGSRGAARPLPPGFLASAHDTRLSSPGLGSGIRRERPGDGNLSGGRSWRGDGRLVRGDGPGERRWATGGSRAPEAGRERSSERGWQRPSQPDGGTRGGESRPGRTGRNSGSNDPQPEMRQREAPPAERGHWSPRREESPPPAPRERAPDQGSQRPDRQERGRDHPPPQNPPPSDSPRGNDAPRGWGGRGGRGG